MSPASGAQPGPREARALQALAERYRLPAGAADRMATLLARLVGDPLAPTAIRDPRAAVQDHFADALVGLELPALREARAIVDIGAGAGLPGLPLALALPGAQVTLVEATRRKCEFIAAAAAELGLDNVEVVPARAEEYTAGIERFDVVTARALARLDIVAEYAAPLLRVGGVLIAWRGRRDPEDEAAGRAAAEKLRLEQATEPLEVVPYPGAQYRHLHVMTKLETTPAAFPRRPGMARKRPLGGPLKDALPAIRERS